MGRPPKYVDEVERLLDNGWNVLQIVKETNISKSTVYDVLKKLKKRARYDFKNLMKEDYLWKYQKTLANFDKTIKECNDEIELIREEYNDTQLQLKEAIKELQLPRQSMVKSNLLSNIITSQSNKTNELIRLTSQRDKASDLKARVYNQGPVVNAIDEWVNRTTPAMGELPKIGELEDLAEKPPKLNKTDAEDKVQLTDEDKEVLKEMEEDEEKE